MRLSPRPAALTAGIGALLLTACGEAVTPSTAASTTPAATGAGSGATPGPASSQASTPCTAASFGDPLPPQDAPADVHHYSAAPANQIDTGKLYEAVITTAKGPITICLEPRLAPLTVNNFVVLSRNHFYDGLTFHRVVADFVIQGGDPTGNGSGGPGYAFADEPVRAQYTAGCLAMANAGPNTNGSQFFICSADDTAKLQPLYNLFGFVQAGYDVVLRIAPGDQIRSITVAEQR